MIEISINELLKVSNGKLLKDRIASNKKMKGVSIDSRTLQKGNLFIAIRGENQDGHKFIPQAFEKGAILAVAEKKRVGDINKEHLPIILVGDTKKTLYDLAWWYRRKFNLPTVGITGTNGKTTTKEMVGAVLSEKYKVLRSPKSYNNLIGIPLTLFQIELQTEILVLELGMNSLGEIAQLTKLTQPDWGVITNIGPAHLEFMKSPENIAKAKFELADNMAKDKTLVLNADDIFLNRRIKEEEKRVITFGIEKQADFRATSIESNGSGHYHFKVNSQPQIRLKVLGRHNIYNALAAFALAKELGIDEDLIKQRLENYKPAQLRMEWFKVRGITLINDAYNANPISTQNALETLDQIKSQGRKIAVLGDMLELGEKSDEFHFNIGEQVGQLNLDKLLLRGEFSESVAAGATGKGMDKTKIEIFKENKKISSWLLDNLKTGDMVLFKASRKMRFEEIVEELNNFLNRQN
ncbi:MAG TPA: UDP-N-acetylmuramoyl-tripeptide--D-alanyl-D-alanine ligase [candidate division Zixibacteria bacterium]